jgi:hypothetical protein
MHKLVLILIMAATTSVAYSHVAERQLDPVSRNGGLAKRVGHYNLEIVAGQQQLELYVYSQGNRPLTSHRATANLRIIHSGEAMDIQLKAVGKNRLSADWQAPRADSIWATLTLKMFGKEPITRLVSDIPVLSDRTLADEPLEKE